MGKLCFGVDLGGTTVKMGVFTVEGSLLSDWEIPTRKEEKGKYILDDIAESIKAKIEEEEQELQKSNLSFYRQGPVEDVLRACYRSAERGEESELLSAADIFQCLKKKNPAAMRGANPASLAQVLVAVGIERKHTKFGNVYRVIPV